MDDKALLLNGAQAPKEPAILGLPQNFALTAWVDFDGRLFSTSELPLVILKDKPTVRLLTGNRVKGEDVEDTQCSLLLKRTATTICWDIDDE